MENNTVIYKGEKYELLLQEKDGMFHPEVFGMAPIWMQSREFSYKGTYKIEDYQLYLESFLVHTDSSYPTIQNVEAVMSKEEDGKTYAGYYHLSYSLNYTGAIVIAKDFVKDYEIEDNYPCFCYAHVVELIFEKGILVTTIAHDKAMIRIRKNLEKGIRTLRKAKDSRCIRKFIKSSFVGKYNESSLKKGWKLTKRNVMKAVNKVSHRKNRKVIG